MKYQQKKLVYKNHNFATDEIAIIEKRSKSIQLPRFLYFFF